MRLTELVIKNLKAPSEGQVTYTDDTLPGFGVRVSCGGVKAFVLVYGRARKRVTLGRYPAIGIADARDKAKELLAERTLRKRETPPIKFEDAVKLFLSTRYPEGYRKPRTRERNKYALDRHFKSFRHEQLTDISVHAISDIIEKIQVKTPGEANHAFAAMRVFCNWAVRRGYLDYSPIARLQCPRPLPPRDRVLSDEELVSVLAAVRGGMGHHDKIVELLILTGQRKTEIASLRGEWIDHANRTITLPASITKNNRSHTFPFCERVGAILAKLPKSGAVFPAHGLTTPFNSWSKEKGKLDAKCKVAYWRLHDLRRTFATNLAALGTPVQVTEKLLNHISGTLGGIVGVYQRHTYEKEMRDAMELWERRVALLTAKHDADKRRAVVLDIAA